ncbi:hypothetical protein M422DRAFT_269213 [Sphaerobolus stellatus SS14]|uniref:Uncharacterized protein n=1 Tax=Sphaerobolus stellatus (strain SS14) TaxID=990650 RepID=A0A0C9UVP1_SPHS4|nr:hypothetical protein M422DRAFT_269213 [Sphaerobolus stellatus SS14]
MGSNPILNQYLLRITVAGHVVQEPQHLTDGTCLFPVNAVTYVREQMQAATLMCWDNRPPCPKAYSPVHITDPLDCIDRRTLLPVIVVEDLTLQVGDHRLAALANNARIETTRIFLEEYTTKSPHDHSIIIPESPYHLIPDQSHQYIPSTASLSSIPPYPNPPPLPILTPTWWKDNAEKLYPPFEASSKQTLAILSQPPSREYLQSQEEASVNNQPGQDLPTSYALRGARDEEISEKHGNSDFNHSTSFENISNESYISQQPRQLFSVMEQEHNNIQTPITQLNEATIYLEELPIDTSKHLSVSSKKRKRTDSDAGGPSNSTRAKRSDPTGR